MREVLRHFRKLLKYKLLWSYLFLLKLLISFLLIVPIFLESNSRLAPSLHSSPLITEWNIGVLVELFVNQSELPIVYLLYILVGAFIFVGIMQFLNGGLYYLMVSGEVGTNKWREFFAECGANFIVHLKITLFMTVIYIILLPASLFFVNMIGVAGQSLMGAAAIIFMLFKAGIIFAVLLAASIFSDSIRAASTVHPGMPLTELIKLGANYYRPNMIKMVGIFLLTYMPFLIIWGLVESLSLGAVSIFGGMVGIILELSLFQISALARTGQKLWYLILFGRHFKETNPGRFLPEQVQLNLE